ncbi:RNA polymerase sigma factor [Chitinophaga cymbidii]|uniref:DNA-directed RNA polymerase sigma-70 factor n=1 Tax=Chitinophaga cymbidii TaxID=1096750 RepID=A0A512RJ40_9BACT|nr:sigma-70 family RNA polymerase sigma factor [Chitinophaga cymbidii]GEP95717.1 hypothetical protein CCY01nite_19770 [Chitinophaga cymbidii]
MQYLSEYTDEQLLTLLHDGSEEAFTVLYNRYQRRVYLEASYILGNVEEAADITQELFTWIWEKRSELSIKNSLQGYLIIGVRRRSINHIAKKATKDKRLKKYMEYIVSDLAVSPQQEGSESENPPLFEEVMSKITPYARNILRKMYFEDKPQQEIAQEYGVRLQSVRNLVSTTMKALRKNFKKSL